MEYTEQEIISHDHEVDSPLPPHEIQQQQQQQQESKQPPPPIGRQGSVYSLTLDEFQNTMCENGKSFGSMNMDEFLNNIWTAEEQAAHAHAASAMTPAADAGNQLSSSSLPLLHNTRCNTEDVDHKGILKHQHSLTRQGSISIPVPLSRKTVDEVWAEIHRSQQDQQHNTSTSDMQQDDNNNDNHNNPEADSTQQQRQLTFGEMTLEDFLVRAGVVREQAQPTPLTAAVPQQQQQTYASPSSLYPNANPALMGTSTFVPTMPVMGGTLGGGGSAVNIAPYQPILQLRPIVVGGGGEIPSSHHGAVKRGTTGVLYPHHHHHQSTAQAAAPPPVCYGGRMGNGNEGAGYAQVTPLAAVASPVSPVSSDPLMTNQGDGTSYDGMDISGFRGGGGRKRIMDGPIEKVVERRQRRMIKNRESAARSRARKQAYTVELEAELNQLKEENAHLKQIIKDLDRKRIQQNEQMKEMTLRAETTEAQKVGGRLRTLRRTTSYP